MKKGKFNIAQDGDHLVSPKQKKLLDKYSVSSSFNSASEIKLRSLRGSPEPEFLMNSSSKLFPVDIFINDKEAYKLPDISMLLKFQHRTSDQGLMNFLVETVKYATEVEQNLKTKTKEMKNLENLNKYLILSQNKKEEIIKHLSQENISLKEKIMKKDEDKKLLRELQMNRKKQTLIGVGFGSEFMRTQSIQSFQTISPSVAVNKPRTVIDENKRKTIVLERRKSKDDSTVLKRMPTKAFRPFDDNSKTHEVILNMNTKHEASQSLYKSNETLQFLNPLVEEEDFFVAHVTGSDYGALINLYDNLIELMRDHRALFNLVFRLKKLIKAANTMTASLVLTEAMEKIVEETCECLECDRASVFIVDEQKEELWSKVAKGARNTIRIPMGKGIVGYVARTGEIQNIMNAYSDNRFNQEVDRKNNYKTNTILCVPIKDRSNHVIGVVQAINKIGGFFTKDDEGLLTILSQLAGVVLRNSLQYDEQLLFHNNLRHILKMGVALNKLNGVMDLMPQAEQVLKTTMNVELAKIFLISNETKELIRIVDNQTVESFPKESGIAGFVACGGNLNNIPNAYNHPLFNGRIDLDTAMPMICLPIKSEDSGEPIAVFQVINAKGIQGLSSTLNSRINPLDYEILEFFCTQFSQIILNNMQWNKAKGDDVFGAFRVKETSDVEIINKILPD